MSIYVDTNPIRAIKQPNHLPREKNIVPNRISGKSDNLRRNNNGPTSRILLRLKLPAQSRQFDGRYLKQIQNRC